MNLGNLYIIIVVHHSRMNIIIDEALSKSKAEGY
jgi:hypothetical protein